MSPKLTMMVSGAVRSLQILVISGILAISGSAQTMPGKPAASKRVEPGLEDAVKWEWHVVPSEGNNWGLQSPEPTPTPTPAPSPKVPVLPPPENRPALYEVKRGDALILIGKKFGITVSEIKAANGLKDNLIRAGQILKIPTPAEVIAMTPPVNKRKPMATPAPKLNPEAGMDKLRLQIFLDREQFSAGPIVSEPGPTFERLVLLYQSAHEDAKDDASLAAKSLAAVANVFTQYKLKADDFRVIAPPRAETVVVAKPTPVPVHGRPRKPVSRAPALTVAPLSYQQMTEMPMLAYRSPWEFVAERFHCQESYLRNLNRDRISSSQRGSIRNRACTRSTTSTAGRSQSSGDRHGTGSFAVKYLSGWRTHRGPPLISRPTGSSRAQFLDDSGRNPASSSRDVPKRA
jgi:LysM repeat protein